MASGGEAVLHEACVHRFLDSWTSLLGDYWKIQADLPAGPRLASESARLLEHVRSELETFAEQQREAELEQLQRLHSARLREAAASVERLTAEETEADRALCAMLKIEAPRLVRARSPHIFV